MDFGTAFALALAAVLAVFGAALALPVRLAARFSTDPWTADLRVAPFGGLLGDLPLPRRRAARAETPVRRDGPARQTTGASPARRRRLLRAAPRLLADLAGRIRIDLLGIDLSFGTGDPALTGQLYGWAMPLVHVAGASAGGAVRLRPEFDRACLAGRAEIVLRVTPLRLAAPLARFGWAVLRRDRT